MLPIFAFLAGIFNSTKIYASYKENGGGLTPTPKNISMEISKGSGFLLFDGHGNPGTWDTHWYDETEV